MARNWNEIGLGWSVEPVARRAGANDSDKKVIGNAQIPFVTDLDKVRKHFGDGPITGSLNGTSWRVMAQDVGRRLLEKGTKDAETIREAVYNRLCGIRNTAIAGTKTVTVKVYTLPNGETYSGTDVTEYRAAYAAALIDSVEAAGGNMDAQTALALANLQNL